MASKSTVFQGKNYSSSFARSMNKRGINFLKYIREIEDRFLDKEDKDTLKMLIDSMLKG